MDRSIAPPHDATQHVAVVRDGFQGPEQGLGLPPTCGVQGVEGREQGGVDGLDVLGP